MYKRQIIGQSGSGKSTLLNIMGTLSKGSSGTLYINGINVEGMNKNELADLRNSKLGFIFQFHYLLPEFTVLENILMPYSISGKKVNKEILERANELIDLVGLTKVKNNMATDLSGGQQQRAAIARALINSPKIILADEPTGALDSKSSKMLLEKISYLNIKNMATILMVTHDAFTASYASRVIFIKDGRIFNELLREGRNRKEFFDDIMDVVTMLGGELNDAF